MHTFRRSIAAAIITAGALAGLGLQHSAAHADAAIIAVSGCANSQSANDIRFATSPNGLGGWQISSGVENVIPGVTPASLIAQNQASVALCGAAFEDNDAAPSDIDGGSIHFHVSVGLVILESGTNDFTINCGNMGQITGVNSCQGDFQHMAGLFALVGSPTPANVVHVSVAPGYSSGRFRTPPYFQATYTRFPHVGNGQFRQITTAARPIAVQ